MGIRRDRIEELLRAGMTKSQIAKTLGISRQTVYRALADVQPPDIKDLDVEGTTVKESLQKIGEAWVKITGRSLNEVYTAQAVGKAAQGHCVIGGIGTQRAIEVQRYLEQAIDMPDHLPADDDEKREVVIDLWYQHAKKSSTAARQLGEKIGVKSAKSQPLSISFDMPDDDEAQSN